MLATTIHFPLPEVPELRDFRDLVFGVPLFDDLKATSKSQINTCNFGSLEIKPLAKDCRKLSLISPTDTDSTAP